MRVARSATHSAIGRRPAQGESFSTCAAHRASPGAGAMRHSSASVHATPAMAAPHCRLPTCSSAGAAASCAANVAAVCRPWARPERAAGAAAAAAYVRADAPVCAPARVRARGDDAPRDQRASVRRPPRRGAPRGPRRGHQRQALGPQSWRRDAGLRRALRALRAPRP